MRNIMYSLPFLTSLTARSDSPTYLFISSGPCKIKKKKFNEHITFTYKMTETICQCYITDALLQQFLIICHLQVLFVHFLDLPSTCTKSSSICYSTMHACNYACSLVLSS